MGRSSEASLRSVARWTIRSQLAWVVSFALLFGALRLAPAPYWPVVASGWFWLMVLAVAVQRRHVLALHVWWGMSSSAAVLGALPLSADRDWATIAGFTSAAALLAATTTIAALTTHDYLHPSPTDRASSPSSGDANAAGP